MRDLYKSKSFLWILLILFLLVWFYALGARTLVPSDEGRYAEMAREMAATGDWITPRLNALKYFEKPPLQTWMNALTFELFGLGEWQARLWSGLCGLLGIGLVGYTGRRVFNPWVGTTAALVLASSFWWAGLSHINVLDMGLSGMMTLSLCGVLLAQREGASSSEQRNWMLASWAGMALAFLSKGPIGIVLPGAVLVLYTLITREWAIWKRLHLITGLILFTAIAAPWFVLVALKNPEHTRFFFYHENFERFTSKVHHRDGPLYYFVPLLMVGIVPWLGVLAQSIWAGGRDVANGFRPKIMLLIWAAFIFFFFSISSSKLPHYILPIFPALALLIATFLEHAKARSWALAAGMLAVLGIAGFAALPYLAKMGDEPLEVAGYQATIPWIIAACVVMITAAACVFWWIKQKRSDLATLSTLALAISGFLAGQLIMLGSEDFGRYRAGVLLVPAIEAELTPTTKLYTIGTYEQSMPFYLRRTMTTVGETNDELDFGLGQEPNLGIKTVDEFITRWDNGQKAVAIVSLDVYDSLIKRGVPLRVVTQDARRVVITNDIK
ncbi:MAG TPA: glycosyltransferase family 39 protein [Burkholderiaceae bacterium]|nr:glycosyltransferase family 39 protein [Burkholderiaceae bacterium]